MASTRAFRFWVIVVAIFAGGALWWSRYTIFGTPVEVVAPLRGPAIQSVFGTGSVEATQLITLAPRSTARLERFLADEGDTVTSGSVVAQFDDRDLEHVRQELLARATLAEVEFERIAKLFNQRLVAPQDRDRALAERDATRAALTRVEIQRSWLYLTSPVDGVVVRREGEIGALFSPQEPVLWIAAHGTRRITAEVDEEDIALVRVGQNVLVKADAMPDQEIVGTVQSITPKGDPIRRTFRVRVSLPDDTPLLLGMTVEVNIIAAERSNAVLIPTSALRDATVLVVEAGRLQERVVKVGAKGTRFAEILSPLESTVQLVERPERAPAVGSRVRAVVSKSEPSR